MKEARFQLINDHFQNYKSYAIPKAQLVIADIPYNIGKNAYGSNPSWYINGDNANGESEKAGKEFFDTDKDFRITEFLHFCSTLMVKEPKESGKAPAMIVFCEFEQQFELIEKAKAEDPDREINVLNLFAYTGGATLAAAAAGAKVTHVDAAKGMVNWAKENAEVSGLGDAHIRYLVDDCVKFVEREERRGHKYDAIIMDPPSYGRGPKGEIWKLEDCVFDLIVKAEKILSDKPLFFLLNSYTTGLQPAVLTYMIETALAGHGGHAESTEIGLKVEKTGLVLPEGASGRYF